MAEKVNYPQIPSTVWWGTRQILKNSPNVGINVSLLCAQLEVQETASKQYISQLREIGILNDENRATPLANRWRMDDTYEEAVNEILEKCYPEDLIALWKNNPNDRKKIATWFMNHGLGEGTAKNKSATFLLIGGPIFNKTGQTAEKKDPASGSEKRNLTASKPKEAQTPTQSTKTNSQRGGHLDRTEFPLNINLQIHIGADAGSEQIEAIFSAMRRYLYDNEAN